MPYTSIDGGLNPAPAAFLQFACSRVVRNPRPVRESCNQVDKSMCTLRQTNHSLGKLVNNC